MPRRSDLRPADRGTQTCQLSGGHGCLTALGAVMGTFRRSRTDKTPTASLRICSCSLSAGAAAQPVHAAAVSQLSCADRCQLTRPSGVSDTAAEGTWAPGAGGVATAGGRWMRSEPCAQSRHKAVRKSSGTHPAPALAGVVLCCLRCRAQPTGPWHPHPWSGVLRNRPPGCRSHALDRML